MQQTHMENNVTPLTFLSPKRFIQRLQPNSGPQMVQQNTSTAWWRQGVLNSWWATKPCPQPKTPQAYGSCYSKPFELTMHAP